MIFPYKPDRRAYWSEAIMGKHNIMKVQYTLALVMVLVAGAVFAQPEDQKYLEKINKDLPHKFKELRTGATLEVVREQKVVKIYMLIDDIEQYDQVLVERSDELQKNYSQVRVIQIEKGKFKNNYVELVDNYPLSPKMSNLYRIKTVTAEGITRMYAPVPIVMASEENPKK